MNGVNCKAPVGCSRPSRGACSARTLTPICIANGRPFWARVYRNSATSALLWTPQKNEMAVTLRGEEGASWNTNGPEGSDASRCISFRWPPPLRRRAEIDAAGTSSLAGSK